MQIDGGTVILGPNSFTHSYADALILLPQNLRRCVYLEKETVLIK